MYRAVARLLIVDDDRPLAEQVAQRLQMAGHKCYIESSGKRALDILAEMPVDLVVLDVMLPGMSGFQVCRRIRLNPEHFGMPIVFVSAMDSQEEVAHGLAQGADDYVTKPFKLEILLRRIEALLGSSSQREATDSVTSLASAQAIKLAVQRAINDKAEFVLAYYELLRIGEFGRHLGGDARSKALRHFARLITISSEELGPKLFEAGHLGGGHFVVMIDPETANKFSKMIIKGWAKHVPKLYTDLGQEKAYATALQRPDGRSGTGALPIIEPLVCMTTHQTGAQTSSVEHFEILSRLRQNALSQGAGVFVDRRH